MLQWMATGSLGHTGQGRQDKRVALPMRNVGMHKALYLGMDDEPAYRSGLALSPGELN